MMSVSVVLLVRGHVVPSEPIVACLPPSTSPSGTESDVYTHTHAHTYSTVADGRKGRLKMQ